MTAVNVVVSQKSLLAAPASITKSTSEPTLTLTMIEYPTLVPKTVRLNTSVPSTRICPIVPSPHVPLVLLQARVPVIRTRPFVSLTQRRIVQRFVCAGLPSLPLGWPPVLVISVQGGLPDGQSHFVPSK